MAPDRHEVADTRGHWLASLPQFSMLSVGTRSLVQQQLNLSGLRLCRIELSLLDLLLPVIEVRERRQVGSNVREQWRCRSVRDALPSNDVHGSKRRRNARPHAGTEFDRIWYRNASTAEDLTCRPGQCASDCPVVPPEKTCNRAHRPSLMSLTR